MIRVSSDRCKLGQWWWASIELYICYEILVDARYYSSKKLRLTWHTRHEKAIVLIGSPPRDKCMYYIYTHTYIHTYKMHILYLTYVRVIISWRSPSLWSLHRDFTRETIAVEEIILVIKMYLDLFAVLSINLAFWVARYVRIQFAWPKQIICIEYKYTVCL